jgi:hypothetical protein
MAYSATAKDLTRPGASFARRYGLAFASVTGALLLELLFHCAFRATSPNRAPSKKRPTVSHMSTRRNFMNCSQLTFPASRPHSWRARRYSTLRTVSQRRSPRRLENQAELDAGGGKRSNHQRGLGTFGMPSEPRATRSKSQAASHTVYVSHPKEVADLIQSAARAVSK